MGYCQTAAVSSLAVLVQWQYSVYSLTHNSSYKEHLIFHLHQGIGEETVQNCQAYICFDLQLVFLESPTSGTDISGDNANIPLFRPQPTIQLMIQPVIQPMIQPMICLCNSQADTLLLHVPYTTSLQTCCTLRQCRHFSIVHLQGKTLHHFNV